MSTRQSSAGKTVLADTLRACVERSVSEDDRAEIPVSDLDAPVFAIEFPSNSVQIFVEKDAADVEKEKASIRAAERQTRSSPVILRSRANVLVSWANEPSAEQRALVESCAGIA